MQCDDNRPSVVVLSPQSPATPTLAAASQYTMYPVQTIPQEMIYAQFPPQTAYQPTELADASMIEAAPAEVGLAFLLRRP